MPQDQQGKGKGNIALFNANLTRCALGVMFVQLFLFLQDEDIFLPVMAVETTLPKAAFKSALTHDG